MRKRINKAIAHLGVEIAGGGRDGCFYFVNIETDTALSEAESVYVSNLKHLPISRWVEAAESAVHREKGISNA